MKPVMQTRNGEPCLGFNGKALLSRLIVFFLITLLLGCWLQLFAGNLVSCVQHAGDHSNLYSSPQQI